MKQAVLEVMVSQDGGVPFLSQSWDGNASDTEVFKERSAALIAQFEASDLPVRCTQTGTPRYLIADCKLYTKENAVNLARLPFMTRIPETLKDAQQVIDQAWAFDQWQEMEGEEIYRYQRGRIHPHCIVGVVASRSLPDIKAIQQVALSHDHRFLEINQADSNCS